VHGLREDLDVKRQQKVPVLPLSAKVPVRLVSTASIDNTAARDPSEYWDSFYGRFPGSFRPHISLARWIQRRR
jgi:hypothetical protein